MQIIPGIHSLSAPLKNSVLTIGNFDGVHRGHQALLKRLVGEANLRAGPAVVMTFDPHPVKVLHPDKQLKRLFPFDDQRRQMELLGVTHLIVEPFSREFSQVPPDQFVSDWLVAPFQPSKVIVGYDFNFGANRKGSLDLMKAHAAKHGFELEIVPPFKDGEQIISSTLVRNCIAEGNVSAAARYLGRYFYVEGLVERGAGRGRTIGIPTANLQVHAETLPKMGVYAVKVELQNDVRRAPRKLNGVCNIGRNPTFNFDDAPMSVETHIFDFTEDIYGSPMKLEFVERLRDEMKFSSPAELVTQIKSDMESGKAVLNYGGTND